MAPVEDISKRAWSCPSGYSYHHGNCYRTNWYNWGRWVVLAIAIVLFLIAFLSCLGIARRRRRRGIQPFYGTGWMAPQGGKWGTQNQHQMHNYNQGYQNYPPGGNFQQPGYGGYPPAPPPPAYAQHQQPQYTGSTFSPNDGYYGTAATGGQQTGVYPPQGVHQRGEDYAPPQGPPPGK